MTDPYKLPVIVMPLNDPDGLTLPHLRKYTPLLATVFGRAFVSLTAATRCAQTDFAAWLEAEPFFQVVNPQKDAPAGAHFRELYTLASQAFPPDEVLHLCYPDRIAFALGTHFQRQFLVDIKKVVSGDIPMIFHRSIQAWETHPRNYRDFEGMVTRCGELLFGKTIDFAWCHLVIHAGKLGEILPLTRHEDISMVAEIVLAVLAQVNTKDVDWLSWEDPFILNQEPQALKAERQQSQQENLKRLAYVIPMLDLLCQAVKLPES